MAPLLLPSPLPLLSNPIRRLGRIPNAASNGNDTSPAAPDASSSIATNTTSPPPDGKPTGIKNRLRARNQARRVQLDAPPEMVVTTPKKKASAAAAARRERESLQRERGAAKKWEEMSLAEKALELYVGEKGLLFWLNKFAYASIFIMVGAWILFRFVGPSLGLYQLDAPPLPPTAVFTG